MIVVLFILMSVNTLIAQELFPSIARPKHRVEQRNITQIIAIGDIHGSSQSFIQLLRKAKIIDKDQNWRISNTIVIQVGDRIDRGSDELQVSLLIEKLKFQAQNFNSSFFSLNGNHDLFNADLHDKRLLSYLEDGTIPESSLKRFNHFKKNNPIYFRKRKNIVADSIKNNVKKLISKGSKKIAQELKRKKFRQKYLARIDAFIRGGVFARRNAENNVYMIINNILFVHGGIHPDSVESGFLHEINQLTSDWLSLQPIQNQQKIYTLLRDTHRSRSHSPIWNRGWGTMSEKYYNPVYNCKNLIKKILNPLGLKAMVVAHTPQGTINSLCNKQLWRIDTGKWGTNKMLEGLVIKPSSAGPVFSILE